MVAKDGDGEEQATPQEVSDLLASGEIPPEQARLLQLFYARIEERTSIGPIPPPEVLREYEEVLPGLADRIMTMAEKQAGHRQGLENKITTHNAEREKGSHRSTTVVLVVAILCGTGLIATGYSVEGLVALISVVGGVVGNSFRIKRARGKELEKKARENP
jgi:uncharacterized membrane protein